MKRNLFVAAGLAMLALPACADAQGAGPRKAAPAAAAQSNELRGTFLMVDGYGKHRLRTFLPGGVLFAGVPAGGPEVFGVAQARAAKDPREVGTYTLTGGSLAIAWGGGQAPETKSFARKGAHVVLDGYTYEALPKYAKGHRLDGRYTTRSYNSMGVAGGGSTAWGGSGTVAFRADGTFDYGQAGFATSTSGEGASASGGSRSSGRYAINGNTITLTFADGSTQHALIHPWRGEEAVRSPESINLQGSTYTRDK